MHPKEQDLQCPGCNAPFPRLGGLIGHIELNTCRAVSGAHIEQARKMKEQSNAAVKRAHDFKDFNRSGLLFGEGPHPLAKSPGAFQQQNPKAAAPTLPKPVFEGDNLIGGLDVLNLPWGPEAELVKPVPPTSEFPPLNNRPPNIMDAQAIITLPGSAWAVKKDLFLPVSLAKVPTATGLPGFGAKILQSQLATPKPDPEPNPHDPGNPNFDAKNYYIQLIDKYKCPYPGCG